MCQVFQEGEILPQTIYMDIWVEVSYLQLIVKNCTSCICQLGIGIYSLYDLGGGRHKDVRIPIKIPNIAF